MRFLLIHKSFPGQFKHIARKLASDGHEVLGLSMEKSDEKIPGVNIAIYSPVRMGVIGGIQGETPIYWDVNTKLIRAESCAYAMMKLRSDGFIPDVVYAHPGWGEAAYVRDIFPNARVVLYGEWFYNPEGQEVGFDPEYPPSEYDKLRATTKNLFLLKSLNDADAVISPTEWQKSRFPLWVQDKIR